MLREFHCFFGRLDPTNCNFKSSNTVAEILERRAQRSPFATMEDSLAIWSGRKKVHNGGILFAGVRNISHKFRAVALLGGLGSHHASNNFFMPPSPS
jgi:hypothetical protein